MAKMYIAMNRFRVTKGAEEEFEALWRNRDSHLAGTSGFLEFAMLRGAGAADHTLYISQSRWADEKAFRGWTTSESFRLAHKDAGSAKHLYLGPPDFEGFAALDGI